MRNPVGRSISLAIAGVLVATACGGAGGGTTPAPSAAGSAGVAAAVAPTKPVEFIISTAPGGGSDIYARKMQAVIDTLKLSTQPVTPVNKDGGSGAVAFQYVYDHKGDSSFIMITLNSFFTTLIVQKLPFKGTDFTPIANLALDPFYLWVNEDSPWKNAGDFLAAAKADSLVVSGTGSKQEDEALFDRIQTTAGTKPFKYVPQSGGGAVATALAGHQGGVVATVNNPSEGKSLYGGTPRKLRPLCTFEPASPTTGTFAGLATCTSQGLAISDYYIMRAIMAAPGLSAGQQAYWVDVFKKVSDSADWKQFVSDNNLNADFRSGADFQKMVNDYQKLHEDIAKQFNWVQ
ncbi:MAG: tripartite tricarboxylate transporter substrate binding protein [Chloroflexota bacterium]|nr:tripartite tricarboxylate transporter substrate binding protein [Chloroflexota bacterium]